MKSRSAVPRPVGVSLDVSHTSVCAPALITDLQKLSDLEIVHRIHGGDRELFGALYEQYFQRLWAFAWRHVRNSDLAQDIVQEVFVRIWASRAQLTITTSLKAYLFAAIRHQALNVLAHQRVAARVSGDNDVTGFSIGASPPGPVLELERAELSQTLAAAIAQLPERQRIAVTLRLDQEMTQADIAAVLEISQPAAAKLLHRAALTIRAVLREQDRTP